MLAPLLALGAFLLGALAGGVLARHFSGRHPQHMARTLGIEVGLLLVVCVWCAVVEIREDDISAYVAIVLLALAMGVRNATVRTLAVPDLTTTVLSLTLTGLAAESPPAGGTGRGSARRIAAVGAMLLGALAGALLLRVGIVLPLAVAALLALATWLVYVPAARRASGPPGRADPHDLDRVVRVSGPPPDARPRSPPASR